MNRGVGKMNKYRVIAEVGSNHGNDFKTAKQFIKMAKRSGCSAVKFQWIDEGSVESTNNAGIFMPEAWIERLLEYGIMVGFPVFFSCFGDVDRKMLSLAHLGCKMMKFPFSQRHDIANIQQALLLFNEVFVSTAPMDKWELPEHDRLRVLYCHSFHGQPIYPVVEELNFQGLWGPSIFPTIDFDGLSSHCLDVGQVERAIKQGARVVEVHMKLEDTPLTIPDSRFSLLPHQVERITYGRGVPYVC